MGDTASRSIMTELSREWFAARIVLVAGFVVAIAFAVIWSMTHRPQIAAVGGDETAIADSGAAAPSQEGLAACRAAVVIAQNFGVVPNTLKFAGGPSKTGTVGRYTCLADNSDGTRYAVTFDLVCRQLNDPRCVSLYTAAKPDGTKLYQRQGDAVVPSTEAPAPSNAPAAEGSAETTPSTPADTSSTDGTSDQPPDDGSAPQQP